MAIKEPRKFVPTDQGHADVLNIPITTLYENDRELAAQIESNNRSLSAQIESIRNDPAGNGLVSELEFYHFKEDTQIQFNEAVSTSKDYTKSYAAPKAHTHSSSDLPSATTQDRGIVQLNNSTSSTATDQAATPSAVKAAYDRANEAFTQVSDGKNLLAAAIRDKNQPAQGSDPFATLAASIRNISTVGQVASGDLRIMGPSNQSGLTTLTGVVAGLNFTPRYIFVAAAISYFNTNSINFHGFVSNSALTFGTGYKVRAELISFTPSQGGFTVIVSYNCFDNSYYRSELNYWVAIQ